MSFITSFWNYLVLSGPFLLFGLLMAGIVNIVLNVDNIKKYLGKSGFKSIFMASLFGIPLPLCSCSVVPTAVTLKKGGAKNGEVSAFIISTPESGVDSIMVTYAMMDIPMTIIRPLAAFLSAFIAGAMQLIWNDKEYEVIEEAPSCCSKESKKPESNILLRVFRFAFVELLDDLALWLTFGLVLGGVMNFYLSVDFFAGFNGNSGRIALLFVGIPLYVCASASTPIAASMVLKGMSPGVALIFLLVGPATNISNLAVIQKYIGKKGVMINILALSIVSLALSYLVDFLYIHYQWKLDFKVGHEHLNSNIFMQATTVIFILLLSVSLFRELRKKFK